MEGDDMRNTLDAKELSQKGPIAGEIRHSISTVSVRKLSAYSTRDEPIGTT